MATERKGALQLTITAVIATVIAIVVLWIVIGQVAPQINLMLNNGTDIQGNKYLEIQALQKACSTWRGFEYLDTIDFGIDDSFTKIGLSKRIGDNLVCEDQKRDYISCVKKCAAFETQLSACAERKEGCYSMGGKYFQRCDIEGCTGTGGASP